MILGIFGPTNSGKDAAAEWFVENCGLKYSGSTSIVISRDIARLEGITFEQAHAQRHLRKDEWRRHGDVMRKDDPARLARDILYPDSNLLVGVRARIELHQVIYERLTDINIWIDRPSTYFDTTMGFGPDSCDIVIPNWWGLAEYHTRLWAVARFLGLKERFDGPTLLEATDVPQPRSS